MWSEEFQSANSQLFVVPECNSGPDFKIPERTAATAINRMYITQLVGTRQNVAVKRFEINVGSTVPSSIIRQVSLLKELNHDNIVRLLQVKIREDNIILIFEFVPFTLHLFVNPGRIRTLPLRKNILRQILSGLAYCHSHKIIHRNLRPCTVHIDRSKNNKVKLTGFGLARDIGVPQTSYSPTKERATRCYRAPEILFGKGQYSNKIDVWAVGCIFAEMVTGQVLFKTDKPEEELEKIFSVLGTPTEETWPGVTQLCTDLHTFPKYEPVDLVDKFSDLEPDGRDLLFKMLCLDPNKRISAEAALDHPYFTEA